MKKIVLCILIIVSFLASIVPSYAATPQSNEWIANEDGSMYRMISDSIMEVKRFDSTKGRVVTERYVDKTSKENAEKGIVDMELYIDNELVESIHIDWNDDKIITITNGVKQVSKASDHVTIVPSTEEEPADSSKSIDDDNDADVEVNPIEGVYPDPVFDADSESGWILDDETDREDSGCF